jgi:signal peptidase I
MDGTKERSRKDRTRLLLLVAGFPAAAFVLVVTVCVPYFVRFAPFFVASDAMKPTLRIYDVLLVERRGSRSSAPYDGEIVVFTPPIPSPASFIKRIVASPGERFAIRGGVAYRNGRALIEPYIGERTNYDLEIKNFGLYVNGAPPDPHLANLLPDVICCSATIGTIPKIRTFGDAPKMEASFPRGRWPATIRRSFAGCSEFYRPRRVRAN